MVFSIVLPTNIQTYSIGVVRLRIIRVLKPHLLAFFISKIVNSYQFITDKYYKCILSDGNCIPLKIILSTV